MIVETGRRFLLLDGRYLGGRSVMASQILHLPDESEAYQASLWDPTEQVVVSA